jgi:CubicO group peptidase (beta-lactamase class C family)
MKSYDYERDDAVIRNLNRRVVERLGSFQRTREAFEAGIRDRLHLGAQLYVSRYREVLIDAAFGEARTGVPMSPNTITLWFSAGKPLTAVAFAQFVERGKVSWNTRVAEVLPEFGRHGKDQIRIAHVMTHTAGLDALDPIPAALPLDEKLARIFDFALPLDWVPGERAGYSSTAGWYVLGAVIERIAGAPVNQIIRHWAITDARLCFDAGEVPDVRERCAFMYETSGDQPVPLDFWNSDAGLTTLVPGGSARASVRELGRFYEALLRGADLLKPETIRTMASRQRTGLFDETFQYRTDMGFGFILNSNRDGMQMPYGYGRAASPETFGHSGNQSSCGFADPARGIVATWACNGMPGERKHQQRQRAINNAIYADLSIQ